MATDSRKHIYVAMMAFVLILVVGGGLVWQFLLSPLLDLKGEYREQRLLLDAIEQRADLKQELRASLEAIGDDADIIEASLLERGQPPLEFIQGVERLVALTGNEYESRDIQEEQGAGKVNAYRISFEVRGSFTSVLRFLREVNTLPALLNIRNVTMGGVGEAGTVKASIVLDAFTN
jgi:Tfp pilus assembly protein PilO